MAANDRVPPRRATPLRSLAPDTLSPLTTPLSHDGDAISSIDGKSSITQQYQQQQHHHSSPCTPQPDGLCPLQEPEHLNTPQHIQNVIDYLRGNYGVNGVRQLVRQHGIAVVHHVANQVAEWEINGNQWWSHVGNTGGLIRVLILSTSDDWHGSN